MFRNEPVILCFRTRPVFPHNVWFLEFKSRCLKHVFTHRLLNWCVCVCHTHTRPVSIGQTALCLSAKGEMLNVWNKAIKNQLILQQSVLKFKRWSWHSELVFPLLVWNLDSTQQTRWKEPCLRFKYPLKKVTEEDFISFKWLNSNELAEQQKMCSV